MVTQLPQSVMYAKGFKYLVVSAWKFLNKLIWHGAGPSINVVPMVDDAFNNKFF